MPDSRIVAAAAASLLALVALTGCDVLAERRLDFNRTENVKITEINLAPGSGGVVVRTGAVSQVQIKRVVRYRGDEPGATYRIEGTTLFADTDCGRQCGVSYDILAPEGVIVRGENGSGDIQLTDVAEVDVTVGSGSIEVSRASGPVRTQTGSGRITITGVAGTVSAQAGSGSIEGRDLGAGKVTARTGSGRITLALSLPGSVRAEASSGEIELSVPAGSYRVKVAADSGSTDVGVTDDPAASALLDLSTGSGDITVRQR